MDQVTDSRKDESQPVLVIDMEDPENENQVKTKDTDGQEIEYQVIENIESDQESDQDKLREESEDEEGEPRLVMECESDGCPDIGECDNDKGIVVYDSSAPQPLRDKSDDEDSSTSEPLPSKSRDEKNQHATDKGSEKHVTDKKTKRKSRRRPTVSSDSKKSDRFRCDKCAFESTQYSDYVLHNCKPSVGSTGKDFTVTYHADGKIFSCTCSHIYHKLKTFHEHLVTHMIPKPYRCSLCKEVFSTRKQIMKHLTAVHPNEKMRFYVNGLKFTQNILEKARKNGSYTQHFDKNKSKLLDGVNSTEAGPPKDPSPTPKDSSPNSSFRENPNPSTNKTLSSSAVEIDTLTTSKIPSSSSTVTSPLTSNTLSLSTGYTVTTVSLSSGNTSSSSINNPPKPLTGKSLSLLNSKNLLTSASTQLRELVLKVSNIPSTKKPNTPVTTSTSQSQKVPEEVIIIDDDDDDEDNNGHQEAKVNVQVPKIETPHPIGLYKNIGQPDLFQFQFSSCGVKYFCTCCKREWESRPHFCFHIWHHQHENEQKCSECDQKTGESGVSCMKTIRLFRKLAFASFTKVKKAAENSGCLKDLSLNQVAFCLTNNIRSYKCLDCNMELPLMSNLKWHVWQHSHSSIICPACSIMGKGGTRYIICPLVEKLVSKIRSNEEQYYQMKLGMAGLGAQAMDSGASESSSQAKSGQQFGMIKKKNETLFVCYICSKQWASKKTFWLHAWTHYHKDRQLCPKCKESEGFPGMTCSLVDKEINIPELLPTNQDVEEFTRLEEDMIITSNEPNNRPQEDHDIIIIDDTPGPGETDVNPNIINVNMESEKPLNNSSGSLTSSPSSQMSTKANTTISGRSSEEDEAEVMIDKADVTVSDFSFSAPSTSGSCSEIFSASKTDISPNQTLVLRHEHDLFLQCDFPKGLRRSILTETKVSKAISRFFCVHGDEFLCLICKKVFFALDELIHLYEHIVVQHMKIPLVQCGYCDFNANKEYKIKGHCLSKHSGKEVKIVEYKLDIFESVLEYSRLIAFCRSRSFPDGYVENKFLSDQLDALKQTVVSACDSNESGTMVKEKQNPILPEVDVKFEVECNSDIHSSDATGPMILSAYSLATEEQIAEPSPEIIKPETETLISNCQEYFTPKFYACGLCTYSTLIMEDLRKHLFTKHSTEKSFPCKHCGFVGLRTDQLMKHFLYHTNNNSLNMPVFECIENNCEYRCNNLEGFLSHLETHNLKQYECHECAETMSSLKELGQHMQLNLLFIFSCPYCSAVATNREEMKGHIESYHDDSLLPQEWTIGKQLVCRDRQLYDYNSKFDLVTQKPNPVSNIVEVEELNCKSCSFYGSNEFELRSHGEAHSKIQEDGAFICPFCAAPFGDPKPLTDHLMKHAETQMSVFFFTCKIDNYCTNVYQKIMQHIHDGQHVVTDKPEDMFDYRQVTYKSQVICCPKCPFKSACRGYLTCHIERVHNGNVGAIHSKGSTSADSCNEVVHAQTNMLTCSEKNCTFSTMNSKELHQHIGTHSDTLLAAEHTQRSPDTGTPFSDINQLKKNSHIYIPTDGPDDQENFHFLETRVKAIYVVGKDSCKCKICKIDKPDPVQMMKHILMKHFGIQYCCHMCQFSSSLLWRMQKHGKLSHNCPNFNIIYSDKIEEVIKELLDKKPKKTRQTPTNTENSVESDNVPLAEIRRKEKESRQNKPIELQKAKRVKDIQQKPKNDRCSISPSVDLLSVRLKPRGRKRKESGPYKASKSKIAKTDRNTRRSTEDSDDAISLSEPMDTQQLPPTEADTSSVQWSTTATDKNMCLLGSDYLDSSLSMLYKTEGNRHQCQVCKEWFPAVTRYWIHHHLNLTHLKMSLYKCGYCEWRAIEKFKIHQHISKHHPTEGIKVQDIDLDVSHEVAQYIKKHKLRLKLPVVKEPITDQPEDTSASSSSSSNINKHYKCKHCQETFQYIVKARIHAETAHVGVEPKIKVMYSQPTVISTKTPKSKPDESVKFESSESDVPIAKKPKKPVEKLYKCPQCSFYTDVDLDAMLGHFKSHKYEKIIECSACGVRSFDDRASKKHHRLMHPAKPEKSNLLPVVNFFKTIKPEDAPTSMLACNSINKQFKFQCKYCHLKSDVDNVMRDHLLQHLEKLKPLIVCSICAVPIPEVVRRKHHFQNVHSSIENTQNLDKVHKVLNDVLLDCLEEGTLKDEPVSKNNFICMKCPLEFQTLTSLRKHYKSFHRLSNGISTFWKDRITGCVFNFLGTMCKNSPKIVDLSKFDVFLCPVCDFRTNDRNILYAHLRATHLKKHINRTMELCYSRDSTSSTSSGPKYLTFRCSVCPEISKSLSEYSEHICCHGNIFKKFKPSKSNVVRCRNCTFASDSVAKIYDHVKTHVTLKQFVCAYCSFEANQSTVVKLHLKSAHPNKTLSGSIIDLKSPRLGNCVDFSAKVRLNNFFEMSPPEFEHLLNSAGVQDVDLSRVPLEIAEKLLLAY